MPDLTQTNEILPWIDLEGLLVTPADMAELVLNIDNKIGQIIDSFGGPDFVPATNGLTIVPGTGMHVVVGGTNQWLVAQGRILDSCAAQTIAINTAGGSDRVDLIAVKASRVAGSTTITREVRPDIATPLWYPLAGTLAAGSCTLTLPSGYSIQPKALGPVPIGPGPGSLSIEAISTSQVIIESSDPADTRAFYVGIYGAADNSSGTETTVTYLEDQPSWEYVAGTSTTPPATPAGYEAFAHIYIHASETSISSGDITVLFPQLIAPIANMALASLAVTKNVTIGGTLSVTGTTTLAALNAAASTLASLAVTTNAAVGGTLGVTGATTLAALTAAASVLASLTVSGATLLSGALNVSGATTLAALNAAATTLASLAVSGNASVGGTLSVTGNLTAAEFFGSAAGLTSIPNSAFDTPAVVTITSADGSIAVTLTVGGTHVDLAVVQGTSGGTTSAPAKSGVVYGRKWFNYGTDESALSPSTDDSFQSLPSQLGYFFVHGVQDSGNSGSPPGQSSQVEFKLRVKSGAGAQGVTSLLQSNANILIALDGATVYSSGVSRTTQTWSATIPDDGAYHVLAFHSNVSGSASPLNTEVAPWIPASASGGVDATKFDFIGPT